MCARAAAGAAKKSGMMLWSCWIAALTALVVSVITGDYILVAASSGLILILAAVVSSDLTQLARFISRPSQSPTSYSRLRTFLTGPGLSLIHALEAYAYRASILAWEARTETGKGMASGDVSKDDFNFAINHDKPTNEEQLVASAIRSVRARFRAKAVVIVLREQGQTCRYYSHGAHGERFRNYFVGCLTPFFEGKTSSFFGLRDGLASDSLLGDFAIFGFRYSISFPIEVSENHTGTPTRGVIWLGYSAEVPPLESETERCRVLARSLQDTFRSILTVEKLSGRVMYAENLNREKTEVIAHLSHDLRSPLSNIKSILSLFQLESTSTETHELVAVALKNCENVAEIVEDLLDYSRHSMGKLLAREELVCLKQVTEAIVDGYSVTARLKGLSLSFDAVPSRCIVRADRRHVTRIVSNIVGNAIKYTLKGSVKVTISDDSTEDVCIHVVDSGVGMTAQQVQHLFTPFTRFQEEKTEGIGLGLALSKILTELNRGDIVVRSDVGKGSTFTIRFPRAQGMTVSAPTSMVTLQPRTYLRGVKVLLVDDDVDCVESVGRVLAQHGCEVIRAIQVDDALSLINFESPDVILSDAHMAGGGIQKILEYLAGKNMNVPTLVLSGGELDHEALKRLGAWKVMKKPADMNQLLSWLDSVMDSAIQSRSNDTLADSKSDQWRATG